MAAQRQSNPMRPAPNSNNNPPAPQNPNRGQQMPDRGQMRTQNFERVRSGSGGNASPTPPAARNFSIPRGDRDGGADRREGNSRVGRKH